MAIDRVDSGLPTTTKIDQLNTQTLELDGRAERAQFDKIELDQYFEDSGMIRKYRRNVGLGNGAGTFGQWVHFKSESGYSIWRIAPGNFRHNAENHVYFDNRLVVNKGAASSESASLFAKVLLDTGSFLDHTTEAGSESGTAFALMSAPSHYLYIGNGSTFAGVQFRFDVRGGLYTLKTEYWNGTAWTEMTVANNQIDDNTSNWLSSGTIEWTVPSDWATTTVNASSQFWVRFSTTTTPNPTAQAFQIVPSGSVVSLLALSGDEITKEQWKWCSFNSSIYVTIRNSGPVAQEGVTYITSASTGSQLQNFFVVNHEFLSDFEDSSYSAGGAGHRRTVTALENISSGDLLFIRLADGQAGRAISTDGQKLPVRYLATENITAGSTGEVVERGEFKLTSWSWTPGKSLYVASGSGGITHAPGLGSGSHLQPIGYAVNTNTVYFDPDLETQSSYKQLAIMPDQMTVATGSSVSQATIAVVNDTNLTKRTVNFRRNHSDAVDLLLHVPGDMTSGAQMRFRTRTLATTGVLAYQVTAAATRTAATSDPSLITLSPPSVTVPSTANRIFDIVVNLTSTGLLPNDELHIRAARIRNTDSITSGVEMLYSVLEYI